MSEIKNINPGEHNPSNEDLGSSSEMESQLFNRPGLPNLAYRRTVYSDLYSRMTDRLPGQDISDDNKVSIRPLRALSAALPDDPALAFLDAWAVVGDVMTFYQERIANEGFLGTAIERVSVLNLCRSIGYELNPGLAARTHLAFFVDDAKGAPGVARIPARTRIQSIPGQDELPQLFETTKAIDARAEWNQMRLLPEKEVRQQMIELGQKELFLEGLHSDIAPGDALLLLGETREESGDSEVWDFRIIDTATRNRQTNTTRLSWSKGLGYSKGEIIIRPPEYPKAFIFRKQNTSGLFGQNAPNWRALPDLYKEKFLASQGIVAPTIACVALSPSGKYAASGTTHGDIKIWNVKPGTKTKIIHRRGAGITAMKFLPQGEVLIFCTSLGQIGFYEISTKTALGILEASENGIAISSLDIKGTGTGDGNIVLLAAGHENGQIKFWRIPASPSKSDIEGLSPLVTVSGQHTGRIGSIVFSTNHNLMATGGDDNQVIIWDLDAESLINYAEGSTPSIPNYVCTGHTEVVTGVVFYNGPGVANEHLFSSSIDGTIMVWDTQPIIDGNQEYVPTTADILNDLPQEYLETIKTMTAQLGELDQTVEAGITALSTWNIDGDQGLLTGSLDKTIKQWKYDSNQLKWRIIRIFAGHSRAIVDLASALGEDRIISAAGDRLIKAWKLYAGVEQGVGIAVGEIIQYSRHTKTDIMSLGWHPISDHYKNWPQLSGTGEMPQIDLAGAVGNIAEDDWIALEKYNYVELYRVTNVAATLQDGFNIIDTEAEEAIEQVDTTRLSLDTNENLGRYSPDKTVVYLDAREYFLSEMTYPVYTPVAGTTFTLDKLVPGLHENQHVIFRGRRSQVLVSTLTEPLRLVATNGETFINLAFGDILTLLEPRVKIDGEKFRWHVVDKFGFEGSVEGTPEDLTVIRPVDDKGRLKKEASEDVNNLVSEVGTILSVPHRRDPTVIIITKPLKNIFRPESVTIHGNVVEVSHGETNHEVLGSGNGSASNQRFRLRKAGLTYIPTAAHLAGESALEVRVNGILWDQVDELDGLGENDKKYIIRHSDEGFTSIIFGDGVNGARLPTGVENVVATYRSGIGFDGNVAAGSLMLIQNKPLGIKSATNFQVPFGAAEPESRDGAANAAPKTVLTLGRVVSLKDYASFALEDPSIGKAQAASFHMGEKWVVHVTVADTLESGTTQSTRNYQDITDSIKANRDPKEEVIVEPYQLRNFGVDIGIHVNSKYVISDVLANIKSALVAAFSFENRSFGQDVTSSEIYSIVHSVDGVVAADIDALRPFGMDRPEGTPGTIPGLPARKVQGKIKPAELLLIDPTEINLLEMEIVQTP